MRCTIEMRGKSLQHDYYITHEVAFNRVLHECCALHDRREDRSRLLVRIDAHMHQLSIHTATRQVVKRCG